MNAYGFGLEGRRAVVTGAGKGIGRAVCLALAASGADVLAFSRSEEDLATLAAEIGAQGRRCVAVCGDVSQPSDVAIMAREADESLGGADVLVNNAGVVYAEPALDTTPAHWAATLAVNLTGAFLCAQAWRRACSPRVGAA